MTSAWGKPALKPDFNAVSRRLIEKLGAIETRHAQLRKDYKRCRGKPRKALQIEGWELEKQWRNVKRSLHGHFRPVVLERDGHKCRVCGESRNLEMARIFEDSLYVPEPIRVPFLGDLSLSLRLKDNFIIRISPEERYLEKNMFTLCEQCHKRFDSFHGRLCRVKKGISTVEEAVESLHEEFETLQTTEKAGAV